MTKRILIVSNFMSEIGGIRNACEDLADKLATCGWSVIRTSKKSARIPRLLGMLGATFGQRKDYEIAQVDVYSGLAFIVAEVVSLALRAISKPYVLTLRGGNLPVFAERWGGRVSRLLNSAAFVTVPSQYLFEAMKNYRRNLELIPNPIDIEKYPFRPRTKPVPHFIWLRSLHKIYNPMLAVKTIAELVNEYPDLHLTMIGPDSGDGSYQAVEREAVKLNIREKISLTGTAAKTQIPSLLNQGDIFLNTTDIDNTPVSVIEALACGLCVVSTNVGGIPYLLEHEIDSLLVPPNDEFQMAQSARRFLTSPFFAQKISDSARRKSESFSWDVILPMWEDVLTRASQQSTDKWKMH